MTATTQIPPATLTGAASGPTTAVCAGRVLLLAGVCFGAANLFQWSVVSGASGLHPAMLGISWPVAVGVFFVGLFRLRRIGGEAARRVAGWSRMAVFSMIAAALALAAASAVTGDWKLMLWNSVATLGLYGLAWLTAFARARRPGMALISVVALGGAALVATRLGTADQYMLQASVLALVALLPGLWLALGRRL